MAASKVMVDTWCGEQMGNALEGRVNYMEWNESPIMLWKHKDGWMACGG